MTPSSMCYNHRQEYPIPSHDMQMNLSFCGQVPGIFEPPPYPIDFTAYTPLNSTGNITDFMEACLSQGSQNRTAISRTKSVLTP